MIKFEFTVKDPLGIHARPAGLIAKKSREFESEILLILQGKAVSASKLLSLMGLGVKQGDTLEIRVSGADEKEAAEAMRTFLAAIL